MDVDNQRRTDTGRFVYVSDCSGGPKVTIGHESVQRGLDLRGNNSRDVEKENTRCLTMTPDVNVVEERVETLDYKGTTSLSSRLVTAPTRPPNKVQWTPIKCGRVFPETVYLREKKVPLEAHW